MEAELPASRKRLILIACTLGSTVAFIDTSVVNVALPAVQTDLGGGLLAQQWVANGYLLTLGAFLLVGGALGDVYGQRRVFIGGLIGFGIFSAACMVAPSIEILIAARALQGMAAAALVPMALALITTTFRPDERGRAIGTWTAWSGVGVALGPVIGGQLVDLGTWRLVFAINLPLVAATLALTWASVPARAGREGARLDLIGASLCTVSLGAAIFGLLQQPSEGWAGATVIFPLGFGTLLFFAFLAWERRAASPMLPLGLFRSRNFTVGNLETFGVYASIGLLTFYLVIYLQQVAGYTALGAGAAMMPMTVVLLLLAGRFGSLADRLGPRLFMTAGPLISAGGLALLSGMSAEADFPSEVLPGLLVFSLGLSMTVAPLTATVLAAASESDAGVASAINNAIARLAGMIGIALVGVAMAASWGSAIREEVPTETLSPAAAEVALAAERDPLIPPPVEDLAAGDAGEIRAAAEVAAARSFRLGMGITAGLAFLAGLTGLAVRNPEREVSSAECPGGQLAGQPLEAAREPERIGV